jgi:hypothetical protein
MLVWLGKQRLGQHDKHELTGSSGASLIPSKVVIEIVPTPTNADFDSKHLSRHAKRARLNKRMDSILPRNVGLRRSGSGAPIFRRLR